MFRTKLSSFSPFVCIVVCVIQPMRVEPIGAVRDRNTEQPNVARHGKPSAKMSHYFVLVIVASLIGAVVCVPKAGSCPPTLPVDLCEPACGPSSPCNSTQLCCPTACGGAMCVDPMTQRHFVTAVKKGRCPEFPRGPWICTHTCTGDSDCPRTLKCCHNRCGALTCQKPEADNTPTQPPA